MLNSDEFKVYLYSLLFFILIDTFFLNFDLGFPPSCFSDLVTVFLVFDLVKGAIFLGDDRDLVSTSSNIYASFHILYAD